jgi:hypothetical protein
MASIPPMQNRVNKSSSLDLGFIGSPDVFTGPVEVSGPVKRKSGLRRGLRLFFILWGLGLAFHLFLLLLIGLLLPGVSF